MGVSPAVRDAAQATGRHAEGRVGLRAAPRCLPQQLAAKPGLRGGRPERPGLQSAGHTAPGPLSGGRAGLGRNRDGGTARLHPAGASAAAGRAWRRQRGVVAASCSSPRSRPGTSAAHSRRDAARTRVVDESSRAWRQRGAEQLCAFPAPPLAALGLRSCRAPVRIRALRGDPTPSTHHTQLCFFSRRLQGWKPLNSALRVQQLRAQGEAERSHDARGAARVRMGHPHPRMDLAATCCP